MHLNALECVRRRVRQNATCDRMHRMCGGIQINLNAMNLELTFRDAVLFTYKKTLLSYKQQNNATTIKEKINKELDTNLNILCNIFYLIDNRNFIECNESIDISTTDYINAFVITKINNIKQLEKKVKHYLITNINLSELNNILLELRDNVEKKIITNLNTKLNNKLHNNLNSKLNNKIYYLLDNYKANNLLIAITNFDEL